MKRVNENIEAKQETVAKPIDGVEFFKVYKQFCTFLNIGPTKLTVTEQLFEIAINSFERAISDINDSLKINRSSIGKGDRKIAILYERSSR